MQGDQTRTHVPFEDLERGDTFYNASGQLWMCIEPVRDKTGTLYNAVCIQSGDMAGRVNYFVSKQWVRSERKVLDFQKFRAAAASVRADAES